MPDGIARQIEAEGGRVTFARFMELALTHPTEGYYTRAEPLLGPQGHFSTAPRLSPFFNRAVARLLAELVDSWSVARANGAGPASIGGELPGSVIELGGGEGDLAGAVLRTWEDTRPDLRSLVVYSIVEIGAGLRARQEGALSEARRQGWEVRWAADLLEATTGTRPCVILGNEFVDALPVHLVDVRGQRPREAWVTIDRGVGDGAGGSGHVEALPTEIWEDVSQEAEAELLALFGTAETEALRSLSRDGVIEIRPTLRPLMDQITAVMPSGCLLTIDYGEWGVTSPAEDACCGRDSTRGNAYGRTIRGYFRHQLALDPYIRVGLQDVTADVDFRAMDLHGREAGFETVLFTTVAALLTADGGGERLAYLLERATSPSGEALEADHEAQVLAGLLDPQGLGGAYKVMLQVRDWGANQQERQP